MGPCSKSPTITLVVCSNPILLRLKCVFQNQSWSWAGASVWSDRDNVADAWSSKGWLWGSLLKGVSSHCLPNSGHLSLPEARHGPAHFKSTSSTPSVCQLHAQQSPPSSPIYTRLLCWRGMFMLVPTFFLLLEWIHLNATLLVKFSYTCYHPKTLTYTVDVVSSSLDLRIFGALNMAQFISSFKKFYYSPQVAWRPWECRECITSVFVMPLTPSPGPCTPLVPKKAVTWTHWFSIAWCFWKLGFSRKGLEWESWGISIGDRSFVKLNVF